MHLYLYIMWVYKIFVYLYLLCTFSSNTYLYKIMLGIQVELLLFNGFFKFVNMNNIVYITLNF